MDPQDVIHLKHLMQNSLMRNGLHEVLAEIGTGMRQIYNKVCFEQLADVISFILTLFVHEGCLEQKLVHTIMTVSAHIFMKRQDDEESKDNSSALNNKRKIYLYMLLNEH